jgi:hypothetical protein
LGFKNINLKRGTMPKLTKDDSGKQILPNLGISNVIQSKCIDKTSKLFTALWEWEDALIEFGLDKDTIETKLLDLIGEATKDIHLCR